MRDAAPHQRHDVGRVKINAREKLVRQPRENVSLLAWVEPNVHITLTGVHDVKALSGHLLFETVKNPVL